MTCPCGAATTVDRARCNPCQRAAVLAACGWTEAQAHMQAARAMRELRGRGRRRRQDVTRAEGKT
jgi:hypothetical protein